MTSVSQFFPSPLIRSQRTVLDIIRAAHLRIGVIDSNRPLTAGEAKDGLEFLNGLLEQWSIENLNVFRVGDILFTTVAGKAEYRIGPGEEIDAERPPVVFEGIVQSNPPRVFAVNQSASSTISYGYNATYDPAYPVAYLRLGWSPSSEVVALRVNQELKRYETVTEQHGLPSGYARPLELALAIELAPSFSVEPSITLAKAAATSKAALRKTSSLLRLEPADTGLTFINRGAFTDIVRGY